MNYLQKSNKKQNNSLRLFLFIIIIVLVFGLSWPRKMTIILFEKTLVGVSKVSIIQNIALNFRSKKVLEEENQELKTKVEELNNQLLQSKSYEVEYQKLLDQNQYLKDFQGKFSRVVSRPPFSPYDTLIIDTESDFRIQEKSLVLYAGVPIGYVEEVFNESARVRLLSSTGIVTIGRLNHELDIEIMGIGGGRLLAKLPSSVVVNENDIVTLSQFDGLIFGAVSSVVADSSASFKDIYLTLPKSLSLIDFVYVDFVRKW